MPAPERVLAFLQDIGVSHLRVYRDPDMSAIRAVKSPGLPTTIVLDPEGREVGRVLGGADWSDPKVVSALESLLPAAPATDRAALPGSRGPLRLLRAAAPPRGRPRYCTSALPKRALGSRSETHGT